MSANSIFKFNIQFSIFLLSSQQTQFFLFSPHNEFTLSANSIFNFQGKVGEREGRGKVGEREKNGKEGEREGEREGEDHMSTQ